MAAIARLPDVGAAAGGLVLTEIKTTIPAETCRRRRASSPQSRSASPAWTSATRLGPLATARLVSGRAFGARQADANVAVADSAYAAAHGQGVGSAC